MVNSYKQIRKELGEYSKELLKKKEIIVLNKVDLLSQKELKNKKMKFEEKLNKKVIQLSTFDKKLISGALYIFSSKISLISSYVFTSIETGTKWAFKTNESKMILVGTPAYGAEPYRECTSRNFLESQIIEKLYK